MCFLTIFVAWARNLAIVSGAQGLSLSDAIVLLDVRVALQRYAHYAREFWIGLVGYQRTSIRSDDMGMSGRDDTGCENANCQNST